MKKEDIYNIVELLKIAKIGALEREFREEKKLKELSAVSFNLPENLEEVAEQFPNRIKIGRDKEGKSKVFY